MLIPRKGSVFGALIVIERVSDHVSPDGRIRARMLVECRACRVRREVFVHKLHDGRVRNCVQCRVNRQAQAWLLDSDFDGDDQSVPFLGTPGGEGDRCECADCKVKRMPRRIREAYAQKATG